MCCVHIVFVFRYVLQNKLRNSIEDMAHTWRSRSTRTYRAFLYFYVIFTYFQKIVKSLEHTFVHIPSRLYQTDTLTYTTPSRLIPSLVDLQSPRENNLSNFCQYSRLLIPYSRLIALRQKHSFQLQLCQSTNEFPSRLILECYSLYI